jgi:hypothetical protein
MFGRSRRRSFEDAARRATYQHVMDRSVIEVQVGAT